ncbi:PAS domain-containing protein [Aureimonas sp. ME7]|uniref:PAS domain-containing protein n=1 Tax=Aureimonas sp. ME7 TaxID=2744252 RepID=UPI0015F48F6B|nr:PAS domain-containing protein [Aureimonas sp. ME7]
MADSLLRDLEPLNDLLGVWTWNVRTGMVVACQDVCEYIDIPADIGLHGVTMDRFIAAIHPQDRTRLNRCVEDALFHHQPFVAEYRLTSTRHGTCWVRSQGHCFRDEDGNPTHISGYLTKIGEPSALPPSEDQTYAKVIELLMEARTLSEHVREPMLGKLISAVLVEAGFQLANVLKTKER